MKQHTRKKPYELISAVAFYCAGTFGWLRSSYLFSSTIVLMRSSVLICMRGVADRDTTLAGIRSAVHSDGSKARR